jgi:hypothetical protein
MQTQLCLWRIPETDVTVIFHLTLHKRDFSEKTGMSF